MAAEERPTMDLDAMLKILASQDGSDLYLSTGAPPCAKFNGVLKALASEPMVFWVLTASGVPYSPRASAPVRFIQAHSLAARCSDGGLTWAKV